MRFILNSPGARRMAATMATLAALATGCSASGGSDGARVHVVATTNILGDIVRQLAPDGVTVTTLMPQGADPHSFQPSARQVADLRDATLVVANGLGLEESLADVLATAAEDGTPIFEMAPDLDPLPTGSGDHGDDGDEHGDLDPHVWMDPLRISRGVQALARRLESLAPDLDWQERARRYAAALEDVHREIEALVATLPPGDRKLVTDHDSLAYFADRYGFDVVGTVIPSTTTLASPSAQDLAALANVVRAEGVRAVFVEESQSSRLADALSKEVGNAVEVVPLFAGSLGPADSEASTYLDLLRTDTRRIVDALSGSTG